MALKYQVKSFLESELNLNIQFISWNLHGIKSIVSVEKENYLFSNEKQTYFKS